MGVCIRVLAYPVYEQAIENIRALDRHRRNPIYATVRMCLRRVQLIPIQIRHCIGSTEADARL